MDTAADDKPATSFDTASQTWKNMARVAVLCSRAEFASNDGNEGTMRREVIGRFNNLFKRIQRKTLAEEVNFCSDRRNQITMKFFRNPPKNFPSFCSSGEVDKERAI